MSTNVNIRSIPCGTRNKSLWSAAAIKLLSLSEYLMKSAIQIPEAYRAKIHWYKTKLECRNYIPRADDIFIVTYPRSGTTWVQMILYQIFTDGDMDFTSINEWSPYLEDRISDGQNIEHLSSPRIIKSHLDYENIPKGPCKCS